jgi:hypothetical protein
MEIIKKKTAKARPDLTHAQIVRDALTFVSDGRQNGARIQCSSAVATRTLPRVSPTTESITTRRNVILDSLQVIDKIMIIGEVEISLLSLAADLIQ